ncbi:MAG TPA: XRE family transcriptional regulator [Streptosporangiaceae bacterium]|nr:XRE family transcriptional regulator [Streptosporangiaceae bacterium]
MADFDPGTGLGPRLRLVRSSRQLSVRELARRVGCSASLISQIERGVSVPSVGVLYSLATELGSSLDYLLFGSGAGPDAEPAAAPPVREAGAEVAVAAGDPAATSSPAIVQRGCDRRIIDLASGVRWERLTPQSEAMTDFLEVIYSPGGHSTDERRPLRHDGREYGLVISGTLTANVGFESYELGPRDSIAFDSSTPHEYLNKTGDVVRAIWVVVHSEPGRA